MLKAFEYRIYPTPEQEILLAKHFGCCRLVYNLALSYRQFGWQGGVSLSYGDTAKELVAFKKEYDFCKEVNSQALQSALMNLDTAYKNLFRKTAKYPKFKRYNDKQSFTCPQNVQIDTGRSLLIVPKFKEGISIKLHQAIKGDIRSCTITKRPSGKYFVSILAENNILPPSKKQISKETAVGIDLGLKKFVVCSDGSAYDNPRYLRKALDILAWKQRKLSRKTLGSNRRKKARIRVARQYETIANQRKDFLHKLSNEITNRFDSVCMESLKVKNMVKNRHLSLSISDAGWGMFGTFLKYKCEFKGKNFVQIGTFKPSSKTCSTPNCGHINHSLKLSDREWLCPECGTLHDRDLNASINIRDIGLEELWRMERSHRDTEVSHSVKRKPRFSKRAVEVSKVLIHESASSLV